MKRTKRSKEITHMFTRYVSTRNDSELAGLSIEDVQAADEQLGHLDLNAGYRIAMRAWIVDESAKKRRARHIMTTITISLLVAGLSALFLGRL
jgi:hypothetical protein